ncbi:glycosyltransferase [uncultured Pedobacter sp.]|uniref:glycosyltransferase n=1 Tax=uncultured Pedobacter sp. TaxID=246139 RepID=UPI0025E661FC|nr:glycosyltransferase [uncultured Pedobacter sp.]
MAQLDILMATYNGAQYLENQLLSLISQTFKDWNLKIHDDGSSDDTIAIIKKYMKIDKRIFLIEDGIVCGGAAANFMHLFKSSTADLAIFCDQDDIWFENKLALLVAKFESVNYPLACFANGYAYTHDRGIIADRITNSSPKNLREQLFLNAGIQGCSLMFNKQLRDKLKSIPAEVVMHDHFITLGAVTFAKLESVELSLMLYRQFHSNKATSNINYDKAARIKSIFKSEIPVIDRKHFNATRSFYAIYEEELRVEQRDLFRAYFKFALSDNLVTKINILLRHKFSIYGSTLALVFKTIMRKTIN